MLPTAQSLPRRWSASDARTVLAALTASGLTLAEFARRTGIDRQRIRRWRSALGGGGSMQFVELVPAPAPTPVPLVEVVSPGGWRLLVPPSKAIEIVRALVEAGC